VEPPLDPVRLAQEKISVAFHQRVIFFLGFNLEAPQRDSANESFCTAPAR